MQKFSNKIIHLKKVIDIIHDFLIKRIVSCCATIGRGFKFIVKVLNWNPAYFTTMWQKNLTQDL